MSLYDFASQITPQKLVKTTESHISAQKIHNLILKGSE